MLGDPSMSSGYDSRIRCRIEEAFPADLRADLFAVAEIVPVAEDRGPFEVLLRGERLVIPYRLQADAALLHRAESLPPIQRDILFCIFSRHFAGYVREQALRQVIRSANDWVIPFVVQLVGEYVIEIHRVIQEALPFLNRPQYAAFLRANPEMYESIRKRAMSYWDCYYRSGFPARNGYPAFEVLTQFDKFLEDTAPGRTVSGIREPLQKGHENVVPTVTLDMLEKMVATHGADLLVAQTTFVLLQVENRVLRVDYEDKVEGRIAPARVRSVKFSADHELLIEYRTPHAKLMIASAPDRPEVVEERLRNTVQVLFHGWRDLGHFANPVLGVVLRDGYGLVLSGPESLVNVAERVLIEHGARTQHLPTAPKAYGPLVALTADRAFVVAHSFHVTDAG
ncbi:MAG: hypothetical protein NVSMB23_10090 [Myxococcales bacterium]